MSGSHTPGPWRVFLVKDGPNKGQLLGVGQETGEGVADAHGGLWGSGGEKLANAHLIAAAPDLLEALKATTAWIVELAESGDAGFWDAEKAPEVIQARAAIAKATAQPTKGVENV